MSWTSGSVITSLRLEDKYDRNLASGYAGLNASGLLTSSIIPVISHMGPIITDIGIFTHASIDTYMSARNVNLLGTITASITGTWDTEPGTNADMVNEDFDALITTAGYHTSSGAKEGYITWDLTATKRISIICAVLPTNSSAYYEVSDDNTNWHSIGSSSAGNFSIGSTCGFWRYIRIRCNNNSNTTSYTKIKASAYQL